MADRAVEDEWHCLFDCRRVGDLRSEHAQRLMRHMVPCVPSGQVALILGKNQKSVCAVILAIVNEAQTS